MRKTFVIAEIGPNHNGSFKIAKKMVNLLKGSGVDAIKFQLANPEAVYSKNAFKADYQKKNTKKSSILEMSKKLQLTKKNHLELSKLCKKNKIKYMCSAFDLQSLNFLVRTIKVNPVKIPSGEITSLDILEYLSNYKGEIFMSTGMSNFDEIKKALNILNKNFKKKITLMHCVSSYPAIPKDLNLNLINSLRRKFHLNVGYSDHSLGESACLAAVAMGSKVIEKHVTLSNHMQGPDHKASMTLKKFVLMIEKIRELEISLGHKKKKLLKSELNTQKVARKSIVSKHFLGKGKKINKNDLLFKRPGTGISPMEVNKIIGRCLKTNIEANTVINYKNLK